MSRQKKHKSPAACGSSTKVNAIAGRDRKAGKPKAAFHSRWVSTTVCISLAAAVCFVFCQTLGFSFVNYDDDRYVYNNPQITHGLTAKATLWAFTHVHSENWHPLTTLSHMLDCQIYGLHPWGHHLGNVLLHAIAAVLLFLVLRQMTGALWRSAFVATVFAIHPLHVESVAWISERKDVLSGLFFMLTLMAYVCYWRKQGSHSTQVWSFLRSATYWLTLLLFALGLMSKPMLVTLPFVLLLLDWWPLQRFSPDNARSTVAQLVWEKIPFLLLSAASCATTIWAQKDTVVSLETLDFPSRLGNAIVSYATYIGQMVYPTKLVVLYPHPANHLPLWKVSVSLVFLLLVSAGVAAGFRKHSYLLVGWLWYLGMLVPVIGLMQVGVQAMANRYTYLPQIGLYIMVSWGSVDVFGSWRYRRAVLGIGAAASLGALLVLARAQTACWKNGVSLMTHALAFTSDNSGAHNNLGNALTGQGKLPEAIQHFERAIQLKPDYAEAYNNLGNALTGQGKLPEAIQRYERAVQLKPDYAEAYNNLGNVLAGQARLSEAVQSYERAIQLNPDYANVHYNLGLALASQGKLSEAVQSYERAIQLTPDYAEAHNNLANVLARQGKLSEAIRHYERALQIKPDYVEANINLRNVLAAEGKSP